MGLFGLVVVAEWATGSELVELSLSQFGRLDGLVNNAGVIQAVPIWDESAESLRRIVEINLLGTMYCASHATRHMRAHGGGSIVNVTSSTHLGTARVSAYGATKGAIVSLTLAWANEGREHGIRVNAFSPLARTQMMQSWDGNEEQRRARLLYPSADAVAPLIPVLLSPESAPLTGAILRHDGTHIYPLEVAHYNQDVQVDSSFPAAGYADHFPGK